MSKIAVILILLGALGVAVVHNNEDKQVSSLDPQSLVDDEVVLATIGNETISLEVADTLSKRIKGLSGRESIGKANGLLFVFDHLDYHGIWMKDMNFAIDIVWLGGDNKVITIKNNVSPESYPEVFTPQRPAKYVIEFPAGFSKQVGLSEDDKITF